MDGETDIGKVLENEKKREEDNTEEIKTSNEDNYDKDTNEIVTEKPKISIIEEESTPEEKSNDGKNILITVGIIIAIFALFMGGFKLYNHFTADTVIDIDQMHQENLDGDLNEEEGYVYNGYSFISVDGLWWTEIMREDTRLKVPLHFGPKEVNHIEINGNLEKGFNLGNEVFIAIDPKVTNKYYTLAISELSFNVVKGLKRIPVGSCIEESDSCDNRTIISCDNTRGKPVIELVLDNQTGIELQGTCIKLKGQEYDIVKAVDRLLYQWYGIMD